MCVSVRIKDREMLVSAVFLLILLQRCAYYLVVFLLINPLIVLYVQFDKKNHLFWSQL